MHIKGAFVSDGSKCSMAIEVFKRLAAESNFTFSLTQFSSKESEINQGCAGVPQETWEKNIAEKTFIIGLPE